MCVKDLDQKMRLWKRCHVQFIETLRESISALDSGKKILGGRRTAIGFFSAVAPELMENLSIDKNPSSWKNHFFFKHFERGPKITDTHSKKERNKILFLIALLKTAENFDQLDQIVFKPPAQLPSTNLYSRVSMLAIIW